MVRWITALAGAAVLLDTWLSVRRTVFTPHTRRTLVSRWSYRVIALGGLRIVGKLPGWLSTRYVGLQASLILFVPAICWLVANAVGFAMLAWAIYGVRFQAAELVPFFQWRGAGVLLAVLAWLSAALLLVTFTAHLVRFVGAYLDRERPVALLAASPDQADAEAVLAHCLRTGGPVELNLLLGRWADWLGEVSENQVSYPALVFMGSRSRLCWLEAAVIMLDAAALTRAVAPQWAPANTADLLDVGSRCLQSTATRLAIRLRPTQVSLHGREERRFADTYRYVLDAGVVAERDERQAWTSFQESRTQYAPQAAAISQRLHRYFTVTGDRPKAGLRVTTEHLR